MVVVQLLQRRGVWLCVPLLLICALVIFSVAPWKKYAAGSSVESMVWQEYLDGTRRPKTENQTPSNYNGLIPKKEHFIDTMLSSSIENQADFTAIREACVNKAWSHTLVMDCLVEATSGPAAIKNQILVCLRFAIEIGVDLKVPELVGKSLSTSPAFDDLFDYARFTSHLASACPKMRVYESEYDIKRQGVLVKDTPSMLLTQFSAGADPSADVLLDLKTLSSGFEGWDWLRANKASGDSPLTIFHLKPGKVLLPICNDGMEFTANFGRILAFRKDLQVLAASALFGLSQRFRTLDPSKAIMRDAFLGIRLGGDDTPGPLDQSVLDAQTNHYLHVSYEGHLATIFVHLADQSDLEKFWRKAYPRHITTTASLLSEAELQQWQGLTAEQRDVVDYMILQRASIFAGNQTSITSWSLAWNRRLARNETLCPDLRLEDTAEHDLPFPDAWSQLNGKTNKLSLFADGVWP